MSDLKSLDHLGPIADELLSGLHADDAMRLKIKYAAAQGGVKRKKSPAERWVPAICCAALALVCVSAAGVGRLRAPQAELPAAKEAETLQIKTIAAGDTDTAPSGVMLADLGEGAKVRMAAPKEESLFASEGGDMAMVTLDGNVYRMLKTPADIGDSLLDGEIGSVQTHTDEPSLASQSEMNEGLSNVADEGSSIYRISGVDASAMVAAEVDGSTRVFQRVSYAGKGPGGESLEDTFDVRGKVKEISLSGVGTLIGDAASEVINVLLDCAALKSADASAKVQNLTVTLKNGLKMQLGVSGDTLCGCGGWSCPEFFEAFEDAL